MKLQSTPQSGIFNRCECGRLIPVDYTNCKHCGDVAFAGHPEPIEPHKNTYKVQCMRPSKKSKPLNYRSKKVLIRNLMKRFKWTEERAKQSIERLYHE